MPRSKASGRRLLVVAAALALAVHCLGSKDMQMQSCFTGAMRSSQRAPGVQQRALPPLEPFLEPVEAYAAARVADSPFLADLPAEVLRWGHAGAMLSVYPMIFFSAYSAWLIRQGRGDEAPMSMGISAKVLHPAQAAGATLFFLIGAQGGLVLLKAQGQPLLDSPHALTALIALLALFAQAASALFLSGSPDLRPIHAAVGTFTAVLLIVHAALGVSLGFSF
mmetsp:Transcript_46805/g.111346  ORF Transcript_46805/g.111346 Transcript_46805/m.111346 type:complete len:222 (+) Transcript_46805:86-751(+)